MAASSDLRVEKGRAAAGPSRRLARLFLAAALAAAALAAVAGAPAGATGARYAFGDKVDYPLVFPVGGDDFFYADNEWLGFWSCRFGCTEYHHAVDILADKMTPVYAVADGTVAWIGSECCSMGLRHDDGWRSWYVHLNNDLDPVADDGQGWGIAPGLEVGSRVEAGQLIGWVGDSGLAESGNPHLHFELRDPANVAMDPYPALREGEAARGYSCGGRPATRVDTNGDHRIVGTRFADVIVGTPEDDYIDGAQGADLICGRGGRDTLRGGPGRDRLDGGVGSDSLYGDEGTDRLLGGPGNDRLYWGPGEDSLDGDTGRDAAIYLAAPSRVVVDLAAGTATADATDDLRSIEVVIGTAFDDLLGGGPLADTLRGAGGDDRLRGEDGDDLLTGGAGDDYLEGGTGDDRLEGGSGVDEAAGGAGTDICRAEVTAGCEG